MIKSICLFTNINIRLYNDMAIKLACQYKHIKIINILTSAVDAYYVECIHEEYVLQILDK